MNGAMSPSSRRWTGIIIASLLVAGTLALAVWRMSVAHRRGWAGFQFLPRQRADSKKPMPELPFGWHYGGVMFVFPGSPAERAGITSGDDVEAVNGVAAGDRKGLQRLDETIRRGDVVVYRLRRGGVTRDVAVRFESPTLSHVFLPASIASFLVAIVFFVIGSFIFWRGPTDRRAIVFFAMCMVGTVFFVSSATYQTENASFRGLTAQPTAGMWPQAIIFFATLLLSAPLLLHLALIFPKPRPIVVDRPEILRWVYGPPAVAFGTLAVLTLAAIAAARNLLWLTIAVMAALAAVVLGAIVRLIARMRHTGNTALKCEPLTTQIAALGAIACLLWLLQHFAGSAIIFIVAAGLVWLLLAAGFLLYPIATVIALYRTYRSSGLEEKRQVKWPLWATAVTVVVRIACGAISATVIFASSGSTQWLLMRAAQILPILFYVLIPLSFAFAIVKYRLMNIDLIIRRTVTYALLSLVVFLLYGVLVGGVGALLVHLAGVRNQAMLVGSTIVVALLDVPLRNTLQRVVDRNVFRERVSYPLALRTLADAASGGTPREELLRLLAEQLQQALQNRMVLVAMRSDQHFVAAAKVGIADEILGSFRVPIFAITRPLDPERDALAPELAQRLRRLGAKLLIPMRSQRDAIGFVALGAKLSNDPFSAEDFEFLGAAASQVAMALETSRLRSEEVDFEQARAMQQILLPKSLPQLDGFELAGMWQPARSVGGDYYDAIDFGDGKAAVCIADVAGKGMPAALLMASLQAAVKATASSDAAPRRLCEKVRHVVAGNLTGGTFITFFYALLDTRERTLTYCNAGHNPPLLVRATGEVERLDTGGSVLGRLFRGETYDQAIVPLGPGDRVVLFTDGVSESRRAGEDFGDERIIDVVRSNRELGAAELQEKIVEAITAFTSGSFGDDVTLVVIAAR
jgi:serine phosphatase RsbU (regulator of sigma subunit)